MLCDPEISPVAHLRVLITAPRNDSFLKVSYRKLPPRFIIPARPMKHIRGLVAAKG